MTWLDNGMLAYDSAPKEEKLQDMALTALAAMRWLDDTRVSGDPDAQLVARKALSFFTKDFDATELVGQVGGVIAHIRQVTVRLKGLVD